MPKVSVIIPTYNRSDLVKDAAESVLAQTFKDLEVIVVDDGSTDDTRSIIEAINDNRVKYFYKENGGCASARNLGLVNCKGEYLAFLDDDDLWPENYLKIMVGHLEEKREYGMAYSLFIDVHLDGRKVKGFDNERSISGCLTKNFFKKAPPILPSATLFRKSVLEGFFWDEYLKDVEDFDFFLRLAIRTKFLCVTDIAVIRRKSPFSMSILAVADISPNAALILERFYFRLGGRQVVPAKAAKRKISRKYRRLAKNHYQRGHKKAAVLLLKKAISYYPFEPKYYGELLKALFLSKRNDKLPNWQMPEPLPSHITTYQKLDQSPVSR